jgi:hypothetical protein
VERCTGQKSSSTGSQGDTFTLSASTTLLIRTDRPYFWLASLAKRSTVPMMQVSFRSRQYHSRGVCLAHRMCQSLRTNGKCLWIFIVLHNKPWWSISDGPLIAASSGRNIIPRQSVLVFAVDLIRFLQLRFHLVYILGLRIEEAHQGVSGHVDPGFLVYQSLLQRSV